MAQKKKNTNPTEAAEQVRLFNWLRSNNIPSFSIPNGIHINNKWRAAAFQRQGMTKGIPDLMIPVAKKRKHGLFIEMKRVGTSPSAVSAEQRYWLGELKRQGYHAVVAKGAEEAISVTKEYLGMEE